MLWPVLVVAFGLSLTLVGLVFTLTRTPPVVDIMEEVTKYSLMTTAEIRAAAEKVGRKETIKIILSKTGVRLLVAGTALQLIGTTWQVIRLACRG